MPLTQVSSRAIEDTLRYVLGANGSSDYTFTGPGLSGAVNDPTLTLSRGHTYVFENRNSSGAHPFYIKTSIANGGTNDAYNTGVTNNGGAGGTEIVFTVPHDAPDLLYYQCSSHSSMNGQLKIAGAVADGSITESKLADDAVTADKLANSINTAIAANTAKDLTALSASNLTSGTVPDARFPATLPAASAANLTNVPAANITGTLPAISGANLTNLPASGKATNFVINGEMKVSQRGGSFSQVANNDYTLDRFQLIHGGYSTHFDVTQATTAPDGFCKSYKLDINVADTSIGSGQYVGIRHKIEAQNLQELAYGTSSAKSITLSFYVRSNVTGTYAINLQQKDNSAKQVNGTYTINSADTWERKTFTFAGDTAGVISNDNGNGMAIIWWLAAGSSRTSGSVRSTWTAYSQADEAVGHTANILSGTSNNFYITGVQLEVGDSASDFAHESYAETLQKCLRYYELIIQGNTKTIGTGFAYASNEVNISIKTHVPMRSSPSIDQTTGADYFFVGGGGDSNVRIDGNWIGYGETENLLLLYAVPDASITAGVGKYIRTDNANARIALSAEL